MLHGWRERAQPGARLSPGEGPARLPFSPLAWEAMPAPSPSASPCSVRAYGGCGAPQAAGLPAEGLPRAPASQPAAAKGEWAGLREIRLTAAGCKRGAGDVSGYGRLGTSDLQKWAFGFLSKSYVWFVFFFSYAQLSRENQRVSTARTLLPSPSVNRSVFCIYLRDGPWKTQGYIWSSLAYCTLFLFTVHPEKLMI